MKKFLSVSFLSVSLLFAKGAIILDPAVVEIFYLLNCEDKITAIAKTQQSKIWPEEKTQNLPTVGTYIKPNLERIIELDPDIVITNFHSTEILDDLKRFKIEYKDTQANSLEDIYNNITIVGEFCKKKDEAKKLIDNFKSQISKLDTSKLKGKKAVFFYSSSNLMSFGKETLPSDIFKSLNLINLADKLDGKTPIVTNEFLIEQDPDFMVVVGNLSVDEFLKQNPVLKHTAAAKNNKIIIVSSSSLLRGSPRLVDEIKRLYEEFIKWDTFYSLCFLMHSFCLCRCHQPQLAHMQKMSQLVSSLV